VIRIHEISQHDANIIVPSRADALLDVSVQL